MRYLKPSKKKVVNHATPDLRGGVLLHIMALLIALLSHTAAEPFPRLNALLHDLSLPLPDMTVKESIVEIAVTHLIASELSVETIAVTLLPSEADVRIVRVAVGGIGVVIDADFSGKTGALPLGSGGINAVAAASSLQLDIAMRGTDFTTGPVQGSSPRTVFMPFDVTTDKSAGGGCVSTIKLSSIKFSGGLLPDILNLIKPIVESLLQTEVAQIICDTAATIIDVNASSLVANLYDAAKPLIEARAPLPSMLPPHWYPDPPVVLSSRTDVVDWGALPALKLVGSVLTLFEGESRTNTLIDFVTGNTGRVTLDMDVAPPTIVLRAGDAGETFDLVAALGLDPAIQALDSLLAGGAGFTAFGVHVSATSVAPLAIQLDVPLSAASNLTLGATLHNITFGGIDTLNDDIGLLKARKRVAIAPLLRTIWRHIELNTAMEVSAAVTGIGGESIFAGGLDLAVALGNASVDIAAISAVLAKPFRSLTLAQAIGPHSAACIIPTRVFANVSRLLIDGVAGADVLSFSPSAELFSSDMAALLQQTLHLVVDVFGQLIIDLAGGVVSGPLVGAVNAFIGRDVPPGSESCPPAQQIPSPQDTPLSSRQLVNWGNTSIVKAINTLATAPQLDKLMELIFPGPPGPGALRVNGTVIEINYTDHFHGGVPATLRVEDLEIQGLNSLYNLSLLAPLPTPPGGVSLSTDPRYTRNTVAALGQCAIANPALPLPKATPECNPLELAVTLSLELHPERMKDHVAVGGGKMGTFLRAMKGIPAELSSSSVVGDVSYDKIRLGIAATNVRLELSATVLIDAVAVQALNFGSILDIDLNCLFAPLVLVPGVVPVPVLKPSFGAYSYNKNVNDHDAVSSPSFAHSSPLLLFLFLSNTLQTPSP